jgi:prevent-host-death family protein
MTRKVSAAEAKAKLSALVAEVAFGGQHVVIERRGKPLAALVSISDLEYVEQGHVLSPHPGGALSIVGAWKDVPEEEFDKFIYEIYSDRQKDTGRSICLEA